MQNPFSKSYATETKPMEVSGFTPFVVREKLGIELEEVPAHVKNFPLDDILEGFERAVALLTEFLSFWEWLKTIGQPKKRVELILPKLDTSVKQELLQGVALKLAIKNNPKIK